MNSDDPIKRIPIKDLMSEDSAHDLATSPEMRPYLRLAKAALQGSGGAPELEAIRQLALEKRYVWRVGSALKWGFADCDDVNVRVDKETLTPEDFAKVLELLQYRPLQFCLFLKALVGTEEMQRIMTNAIRTAQQVP